MKKETKVIISKTIIGIHLIVCAGIIIWAYSENPIGSLIGSAGIIFSYAVMWSAWVLGANYESRKENGYENRN